LPEAAADGSRKKPSIVGGCLGLVLAALLLVSGLLNVLKNGDEIGTPEGLGFLCGSLCPGIVVLLISIRLFLRNRLNDDHQ
jgi:hypothetical protein